MMKKKLLFHLGHSAGFYSEFNNMIFAILYCRINNIEFILYSQDANFKVKNGWTDYFDPFCKEICFRPIHYINGRSSNPQLGIKSKLYSQIFRLLFRDIYLTQDLWSKFRSIDKSFESVFINDELILDFMTACNKIIDHTYNFNFQTKHEIDRLIKSVNISGKYVGIHIRAGDKRTECNLIEIEKYMEKVKDVSNLKQIFVSTDDYTLYESLVDKYKDYTFHTISENNSKGYLQRDFVMLSPDMKRIHMVNMFASMELLLKAESTICTFSSNIGMFIGLVKKENVYPVDFSEWMIW